jgi:hypothetical protein
MHKKEGFQFDRALLEDPSISDLFKQNQPEEDSTLIALHHEVMHGLWEGNMAPLAKALRNPHFFLNWVLRTYLIAMLEESELSGWVLQTKLATGIKSSNELSYSKYKQNFRDLEVALEICRLGGLERGRMEGIYPEIKDKFNLGRTKTKQIWKEKRPLMETLVTHENVKKSLDSD